MSEDNDPQEYLFKKEFGTASRAQQLDYLLKGARAATMVGRALLWVSGFITAIAAAIVVLGGRG